MVPNRQRLSVELRPGETTIVSWKKLLKDATTHHTPPPSSLPSLPAPPVAEVAKEGDPTSRLTNVIERIDRLYVGRGSSDEEDLNDVVRDEDEYDTDDSFIDDAELDEYFQVDNSAIKHDGFFVNRGKLERIEPTESPIQQQKKRKRKDLSKDPGRVAVKDPNKNLKVGKKNEKPAIFDGNHPSNVSHVVALPSVRSEGVKLPNQVVEEAKEGEPTSRLNTVIERIERSFEGKASSDEEDLNNVLPDEDKYDTEDSFIDNAELDEYFQVDNSAIKHDGFLVNSGTLERIEPTESPNNQQKKRRRKDMSKDPGRVAAKDPNKHLKVGKKNEKPATMDEKPATLDGNHPSKASNVVALPTVQSEGVKLQNQVTGPDIPLKKKTAEAKSICVVAGSDESNVDGKRQEKEVIQQKQAVGPSTNYVGEVSTAQKSSHGQGKSPPVRPSNNVDEPDQTTQLIEFSSSHERSPNTRPNGNKPVSLARKEGSSVRPRSTMLEKAIRDLEKLVAESRPPVSVVQDGENQSVKRRLPSEVKQKIAKVARIAQASHGKISKEVLNRLMSIVGHMIQLRSLKRNLNNMVNMGLSAKKEKDHRVQLIKREVADMVQARIPLMKSKAQEQLGGMSDDFQQSNTEEIAALKRKYSMDDSLEDKIRDLYDLYVEGLEGDAGPQVRKLYAELAAFWPTGFMDNHGIKRAVCRAKDRRRPLQSRQQSLEKVKKKKKALVPNPGVESNVEASSPAQSLHTSPSGHGSSENKLISSKTAANPTSQMPGSNVGISGTEKPKQEKMKGTLSSPSDTNKTELPTKKETMTPDLEQSEIECSHESENIPKEGMTKRQHLTSSMLHQLFET